MLCGICYMKKTVGLKWPHGNGNGSTEEELRQVLDLQKLSKAGQSPPKWEKQYEHKLAVDVREGDSKTLLEQEFPLFSRMVSSET